MNFASVIQRAWRLRSTRMLARRFASVGIDALETSSQIRHLLRNRVASGIVRQYAMRLLRVSGHQSNFSMADVFLAFTVRKVPFTGRALAEIANGAVAAMVACDAVGFSRHMEALVQLYREWAAVASYTLLEDGLGQAFHVLRRQRWAQHLQPRLQSLIARRRAIRHHGLVVDKAMWSCGTGTRSFC